MFRKVTSKYQAKIIYVFPSSDPDGLADMLTYANRYIRRPCEGHTHLSRHCSITVFYKIFNTTLSLKLIKVFKSFLKYRILSVLKKKETVCVLLSTYLKEDSYWKLNTFQLHAEVIVLKGFTV